MTGPPSLVILGTRGIPARHGGFETFAERLALHLVGRGWHVEVFCQAGPGDPRETRPESWEGVRLRHLRVPLGGPAGTVLFDLRATLSALRRPGAVLLTLGYNTAVLTVLTRLAGRVNLINMDGLEWQRRKWSAPVRAWFRLNERLGCRLGSHLIADHPRIADHLSASVSRRKITCIPYGADCVTGADPALLDRFLLEPDRSEPDRSEPGRSEPGRLEPNRLEPDRYALVVARPEPENTVLEIVTGFSRRRRDRRLIVLGRYTPSTNPYHRAVVAAAGPEVMFAGAIYDPATLAALRLYCRVYVHGHQVGGTNPALVEALGAGTPVLAHDNPFNRWVAGPHARYFADADGCATGLDELFGASPEHVGTLRQASRARHAEAFTWAAVLDAYEALLWQWRDGRPARDR